MLQQQHARTAIYICTHLQMYNDAIECFNNYSQTKTAAQANLPNKQHKYFLQKFITLQKNIKSGKKAEKEEEKTAHKHKKKLRATQLQYYKKKRGVVKKNLLKTYFRRLNCCVSIQQPLSFKNHST